MCNRGGVDVIIPKPIRPLVTRRVLVMTYEEGFKITDTHMLDKHAIDRLPLVRRVAQVCWGSGYLTAEVMRIHARCVSLAFHV